MKNFIQGEWERSEIRKSWRKFYWSSCSREKFYDVLRASKFIASSVSKASGVFKSKAEGRNFSTIYLKLVQRWSYSHNSQSDRISLLNQLVILNKIKFVLVESFTSEKAPKALLIREIVTWGDSSWEDKAYFGRMLRRRLIQLDYKGGEC